MVIQWWVQQLNSLYFFHLLKFSLLCCLLAMLLFYEYLLLINLDLYSASWRKFRAQLKLDPGNVALYLG